MNCPHCQKPMQRFKARLVAKSPTFGIFGCAPLGTPTEWVPQCYECDDCDHREIDQSGEYLEAENAS